MYSLMYNYPPQQKKYKKNTSNREREQRLDTIFRKNIYRTTFLYPLQLFYSYIFIINGSSCQN